jgi:hypothetical protein
MCKEIQNGWSRGPELNRRPDVFSIRTLLLICLAVTCALQHRLARYLAGFVPKLFPSFFWGDVITTPASRRPE